MLVKMFLCFYLNVPPWSFNPIHLSSDDENKVEPVAGDLQSLEVMKSWRRLQPQIQRQAWAQGLACGAEQCFSFCGCLHSAWTSVGRSQTSPCGLGFLSCFIYKPFWTLNLGFVVVGRVWNVVLISVWEPHGLGHVTLHLWTSIFSSVNWELGWLTSNDFQVCDPEPVNSAFYFILFYYTQHAFWGRGDQYKHAG